ncbi:MAG: ABC transporter permease subunit [Anaerolineae bacterium]|nr:ABC transporter permease subunit [Anaerolineae bacterium]
MRRLLGAALLSAPLFFLAVFYLFPLLAILEFSLVEEGRLALAPFRELTAKPYYRETLWFTTWQAALSTLLTLALAIPGAQVFARYRFPGKAVGLALATVPFVLPTVVVATAFTALVGPNGALNRWLMDLLALDAPPIRLQRTLELILLAHVFYNYAVALRIISSFWANQGTRLQEAAAVLGASPWGVFWRVTLPALLPAIAAAGSLVFIFASPALGWCCYWGGRATPPWRSRFTARAPRYFDLPIAAALGAGATGCHPW